MKRLSIKINSCLECEYGNFSACMKEKKMLMFTKNAAGIQDFCTLPEWDESPVDMEKLKENIKYAANCGEDLRLVFSLVKECAEILGVNLEAKNEKV